MSNHTATTYRPPFTLKLQKYLLLIMLLVFGLASATTPVDTISSGQFPKNYYYCPINFIEQHKN